MLELLLERGNQFYLLLASLRAEPFVLSLLKLSLRVLQLLAQHLLVGCCGALDFFPHFFLLGPHLRYHLLLVLLCALELLNLLAKHRVPALQLHDSLFRFRELCLKLVQLTKLF